MVHIVLRARISCFVLSDLDPIHMTKMNKFVLKLNFNFNKFFVIFIVNKVFNVCCVQLSKYYRQISFKDVHNKFCFILTKVSYFLE